MKHPYKRSLTLVLFSFVFFVFPSTILAQNPNNPLAYGNQALLFGSHQGQSGFGFDATTQVAYGVGLGAFLENPASLAFADGSSIQIGLRVTGANEDATYLGNSEKFEDQQSSLGNVGFIYKYPTRVGSFVIGAAYHQLANYQRAVSYSGQNTENTLTDQFKLPGSTYSDLAFNTYVTDVGDEFGDWDESIFRLGFDTYGEFLGVFQQGEDLQSGHNGEYSIFVATEFRKNLMIGASLGVLSGSYSFDRILQELDDQNLYNGIYIDSDGDELADTDIDNFIFTEKTDSDFNGLRGRIGMLYQPLQQLRIGFSYTLPTRIEVEERFDGRIFSTFDNGVNFDDSIRGQFQYALTYPGRVSAGLSYSIGNNWTVALSADRVNYSELEIDFQDETLFDLQQSENTFITQNFAEGAMGYRVGVIYQKADEITIHAGYGMQQSALQTGEDSKHLFSIGTSLPMGGPWQLDLGLQYSIFDQQSVLYTYGEFDYSTLPQFTPGATIRAQEIERSTSLVQLRTTIRFVL